MGHPIDKLTIRGFKSIRALESLELKPLNILIGGNGAGKSNFVDFFRFLCEMIEDRLKGAVARGGGAERFLFLGSKITDQIEVDLRFGGIRYYALLRSAVPDDLTIAAQNFRLNHKVTVQIDYPIVSDKVHSQMQAPFIKEVQHSISSWRVYHFHDTGPSAKMKKRGAVHDNELLHEDASNLAAFLYWFRGSHPDQYAYLIKTIRLAIPFFDDFRLDPTELPTGEQQVMLLWRQTDSDYPFWPSQLSDGSLRFICLATALLQPNPPSTIIIDEPELGLHPHAITLLASLLRKASKRMQVIVSTQSVTLVNHFEPEDLIVVDREDGASVFRRLDSEQLTEWLEDYTLGDLWQKNVIGGGPLA